MKLNVHDTVNEIPNLYEPQPNKNIMVLSLLLSILIHTVCRHYRLCRNINNYCLQLAPDVLSNVSQCQYPTNTCFGITDIIKSCKHYSET
jgi:hypothetical protein